MLAVLTERHSLIGIMTAPTSLGLGAGGRARSEPHSREARAAPILHFSLCKDYELIAE